jgi:hypothetical protein
MHELEVIQLLLMLQLELFNAVGRGLELLSGSGQSLILLS